MWPLWPSWATGAWYVCLWVDKAAAAVAVDRSCGSPNFEQTPNHCCGDPHYSNRLAIFSVGRSALYSLSPSWWSFLGISIAGPRRRIFSRKVQSPSKWALSGSGGPHWCCRVAKPCRVRNHWTAPRWKQPPLHPLTIGPRLESVQLADYLFQLGHQSEIGATHSLSCATVSGSAQATTFAMKDWFF